MPDQPDDRPADSSADPVPKKKRRKVVRERSAGVVLFREPGDGRPREFLLLDYGRHWDYAKGHLESGETDEQAALRELREETGIRDVALVSGFSREIIYHFQSSRKGLVRKEVIFFTARLPDDPPQEVALSHEHVGHAWLPLAESLERLTFANARAVLTAAAAYLESAA